MGSIRLLDCTLRDGGFVNDWRFGVEAIPNIIRDLERSGIEAIEIGFLKNEPYQPGRVVFNDVEQIKQTIGKKKPGVLYSVMCELVTPLPLDRIPPAEADGLDLIRMMLWKTKRLDNGDVVDALQDGYTYCKALVDKGYRLCIQPVRVDQYSDDEFVSMLHQFSELDPLAIYIVDSWGTQNPENMLHYMNIADQVMPKHIALGYHGHNSMMQALSIAQALLWKNYSRDIMIDASVHGIGRSAGNLHSELIAKYLNDEYEKHYEVAPILQIYENYIQKIRQTESWGYSIPYFLTAAYNCNPAYAKYLSGTKKLGVDEIQFVLSHLSPMGKIIYSQAEADRCLELLKKGQ